MTEKKHYFVDPIRDLQDIAAVKRVLLSKKSPRDYVLFVVGIHCGLRASDLVNLRVGDIRRLLETGEPFQIAEKKTGKKKLIDFGSPSQEAFQRLLRYGDFVDHELIFQKHTGGRMSTSLVSHLVKRWCLKAGLHGHYSSHTLRKTFGYWQRVQLNTAIPVLMTIFNHQSQRQTLDYLGIQPEEVSDAYKKLSL